MSALAISEAYSPIETNLSGFVDNGVSDDAKNLRITGIDFYRHLTNTLTFATEKSLPNQIQTELYEILEEYSEDDWDGCGAKRIDWETIAAAYNFLLALPRGSELPELDASPEGEIIFEWYRSPVRLLNVTINKQNEVAFAALMGGHYRNHGTLFFNKKIPEEIISLIKKV